MPPFAALHEEEGRSGRCGARSNHGDGGRQQSELLLFWAEDQKNNFTLNLHTESNYLTCKQYIIELYPRKRTARTHFQIMGNTKITNQNPALLTQGIQMKSKNIPHQYLQKERTTVTDLIKDNLGINNWHKKIYEEDIVNRIWSSQQQYDSATGIFLEMALILATRDMWNITINTNKLKQ